VHAAFAAGFERVTAMTAPGNQVALHVLAMLAFPPQGETTFDGRRYALFVTAAPGTRGGLRASAAGAEPPAARS